MARRPRLEYAGATYHVLNRGREAGLFGNAEAARQFLECLGAAVERMHWKLHAFCILPNGYQLAIETPRGNLVRGVHWLQSAFGNGLPLRPDRRRNGFRGRYRAVLVEPGLPLSQVVDYIHLSPVLEGIVPLEQVGLFRWSSLRAFVRGKDDRLSGLSAEAWLPSLGECGDDPQGWEAYLDRLTWIMGSEERQRESGFGRIGRGWSHGSDTFRKAQLARASAALRGWGGDDWHEVNRLDWERRLEAGARTLERSLAGASREPKSAGWKIALAAWMKGRTSVSNRWLGERLHMGPPDAVSRYAGELRDGLRPAALPYFTRLQARLEEAIA